jgi:hypothetical protein
MTDSVTFFSNGGTFGLDKNSKVCGFLGINLDDLTSSATVLDLPAAANGGVVAAHVTDAMTHSVRIKAGTTTLYLMATTTATNRS